MKLPDYNNSNLNLINSLLKHYGVDSNKKGLPIIDKLLENNKYKKVVLIIMDGMGHHNLVATRKKDSILLNNEYGPISTIFPSTTAAVMTMYEAAKPVCESGWVAWSTYFKEINKSIDLFTGRDSLSQEIVNYSYKDLIKYESIYKMINKVAKNIDVYQIYPENVKKEQEPCKQQKYNTIVEMIDIITNLIEDNKEKFVFAYCNQPDSSMHSTGPNSKEVNLLLDEFEDLVSVLYNRLDDETLIIITADHGQIEITQTYYLNKYKDLMDMLVMPPLLEGRVRSFFVKNGYLLKFKEKFLEYFGEDFILYNRNDILNEKIFGDGIPHNVFDDSIGDYVAIAVKNAVLDYISPILGDDGFVFKGHHGGLTKEEMEIPLIILKKGDIND